MSSPIVHIQLAFTWTRCGAVNIELSWVLLLLGVVNRSMDVAIATFYVERTLVLW